MLRWLWRLPRHTAERLDSWLSRYGAWANEREKRWVAEGYDAVRRSYLSVAPRLVLTFTLVLLNDVVPEPWETLIDVLLAALAGSAIINGVRRMSAYRSGWLDGRHRMIRMGQEHADRGNRPQEWLETEVNYDAVVVLGMPPIPAEGSRET